MRRSIVAFACAVLAACTDPSSARGVAERFLDAHYVKIDLGATSGLVAGVAEKKIADERRLIGEQAIDETTRKPSVYYKFVEERDDTSDRLHLVYRATFAVDGADTFDRRIHLMMQRSEGNWKVVNFQEFE